MTTRTQIALTGVLVLIFAWGMHELYLREACRVSDFAQYVVKCANSDFDPLVKTYVENIDGANALVALPGFVFKDGETWHICWSATSKEIFGENRVPSQAEFDNALPLLQHVALRGMEHAVSAETVESKSSRFFTATNTVDTFAMGSPDLWNGLHDLLKTSLVQAWGAFEVLAEDLWKAAIKIRPALETRTQKEKDKSGHRSRGKIANLYRFTFRIDNTSILDCVESPKVHALALLRNVLVHSTGIIDSDFIKHRKGIVELDCILENSEGYEIPFTGIMVRHFIDPVIPIAFALVKNVDEWLINHP